MTERTYKTLIYAADVSVLSDGRVFGTAVQAVSEQRRQKTASLRFDKDKYLSLGAELLLKKAVSDFGKDEALLDTIVSDKNGKPYFAGEKEFFFNLSHSGHYVLCAVSNGEIGCDIEEIKDIKENLAKKIYSPGECADIFSKSAPEEQSAAFYRYWTLRESYMKYTGLGLSLPFSDFEIGIDENVSVFLKSEKQAVFFKEFSEIPGYACAVCAKRPISEKLLLTDLRNIL